MSTCLSSKEGVRARKKHRCPLCGEVINAGDLQNVRTGASPDGMWTMHMHPECEHYEQFGRRTDYAGRLVRIVDADWYEDISEPAFDRKDAIAFAASPAHQPKETES